jgi:hypothetical protein
MKGTLDKAIDQRMAALGGEEPKGRQSRIKNAIKRLQRAAVGEDEKAPVTGKGHYTCTKVERI